MNEIISDDYCPTETPPSASLLCTSSHAFKGHSLWSETYYTVSFTLVPIQQLCPNQCTCNGGWTFRNNSATQPTAAQCHRCDITPYQAIFFVRTSNFASSLTQHHCLLPQCYCFWWNWQNTEQNVQCSSLSLYRQIVYSGKYSGHCVVLVLLIEWLLFIIR